MRPVLPADRRWRRSLVAVAAATGLAAGTAVVATPAAAAPAPAPAAAADLASGGVHAPVPKLAWTACGGEGFEGIECATARVPLDYDKPNGRKISVALARDPADDPGSKIGSLFINPGGPGGSGVDLVPFARFLYRPEVLARFDIVGVDPRGVARSTPARCFRSAQEQAEFFADLPFFPVGARQTRAFLAKFRDYTRRCAAVAGPIIDHASTANFVRDLDLLRQAVGDPGFTFAGYSYGSIVGQNYAVLFPKRVRAVVIDGVLDLKEWTVGASGEGRLVPFSTRVLSAKGASETLGAFFRTCAAAGPERCAFTQPGATAGDLAAKYATLARRLLRRPVTLPQPDGSTVEVTYADLVGNTLGGLYDSTAWPDLAAFVQQLYELSSVPATAAARTAAARALSRLTTRYQEEEPLFDSGFDAVSCADTVNPRNQRAWPVAAALQDRRYPYFGSPWTYASLACATWPGRDTDRYLGGATRRTARPVLVVGTRYDPATRYQGAVKVARTLPGARLLSLNGYGHTSIQSSVCVDAYTADYLVSGALPPAGTVCQPDRQPFDPLLTPAQAAGDTAAKRAVVAGAVPAGLRRGLAAR